MTGGVRTAPCSWPISYSTCNQGESEIVQSYFSMPASGMATYEQMAVGYLWRWTGRSLGTCQVKVRPAKNDLHPGVSTFNGFGPFTDGGWGGLWRPVIIDGLWYNLGCGDGCGGDSCHCNTVGPTTLRLPGPIASVTSVVIDGVPVSPSAYRVDNSNLLVRQDGQAWPRCQQMDLPDGAVGTFDVTYQRGVAVPAGGDVCAGVLALELWKASCNDDSCGLPKRIQTITRQGVTVAMIDNFNDVKAGATGIWIIDAWLASLNQVPRRARVLSPDLRRPRVTTFGG